MADTARQHTATDVTPSGAGLRTRPAPPGKTLDFVVIGAQRAGTTSMWMYLRTHPELYLPPNKEISFFAHERFEQGLDWYLEEYFSLAPPEASWGTSTPHYMLGGREAPVETVVARMWEVVPAIRLIALLRDPIERALSEYKLTAYRGLERRTVSEAMRQQLKPGALRRAREAPWKGTTYIVQGEYGRILELYLSRFPREQILLMASSELAERSMRTMRRVFEHLGVDADHVPANLDRVYHKGGTVRRVSREAEGELRDHLLEHVWSRIPDPLLARDAMWEFDFWFRHWNTVSGDGESQKLKRDVRAALEAHYRADAESLREATGFEPPWLEAWDRRRGETPIKKGTRSRAGGTGAASGRTSGDSGPTQSAQPPTRKRRSAPRTKARGGTGVEAASKAQAGREGGSKGSRARSAKSSAKGDGSSGGGARKAAARSSPRRSQGDGDMDAKTEQGRKRLPAPRDPGGQADS